MYSRTVGYTPNWTTEFFKITKLRITNPATYPLEDITNRYLNGGFYEEEPTNLAIIGEDILQRKSNHVKIRWLSFYKLHYRWIDGSNYF